ncbi:inorganic phosphate transporter [Rhodobacterales bacterium]|nr:inorganic phosphate transporter [Rhodobacterales bacterium]
MGRRLTAPGLALIFLVICTAIAATHVLSTPVSHTLVLVAATVIGGYMALNIGANDVANNVGPAVGARAVSLTGALIIAAICESAGAFLAGGDVVSTVSRDILVAHQVPDSFAFMQAMLTAMAAAALWINIATLIGAPVSTTHSIVGGVVGAGIAVGGFAAIDWPTVSAIAATWVLSPVLGGVAAAALLAFIYARIVYIENRLEAARFWLPILLGITGAIFIAYVLYKTGTRHFAIAPWLVVSASVLAGGTVWLGYSRVITAQLPHLDRSNGRELRTLFTLPLMITAGLLSFAHGANDVANAIGPLAAIVQSQTEDYADVSLQLGGTLNADFPLWVTGVGALGISAGLLLFGRRLVTVVGKKITKLSPVRAFCITLATAVTVLGASGLGFPVSSTHIAVGAVFGVGFYREWYRNRYVTDQNRKKPRKLLRNREVRRRRLLVRRANLLTIVAAWGVTVPISALLAAALFQVMRLILI